MARAEQPRHACVCSPNLPCTVYDIGHCHRNWLTPKCFAPAGKWDQQTSHLAFSTEICVCPHTTDKSQQEWCVRRSHQKPGTAHKQQGLSERKASITERQHTGSCRKAVRPDRHCIVQLTVHTLVDIACLQRLLRRVAQKDSSTEGQTTDLGGRLQQASGSLSQGLCPGGQSYPGPTQRCVPLLSAPLCVCLHRMPKQTELT